MKKRAWLHLFPAIIGTLMIVQASLPIGAQGFVDDPPVRVDQEVSFLLPQTEQGQPSIHCLLSSILRRRTPMDKQYDHKYRTLCEADWGRFATFSRHRSDTGVAETLLVDIDSGEWLLINDTPNISPQEENETRFEFAARAKNPRDHTYRLESHSWRFDPFDGENLESARSRNWKKLKEMDPELTDLITRILRTFGNVINPETIIMTHTLEELVYSGKALSAPGQKTVEELVHSGKALSAPSLKARRIKSKIEPADSDHEITAFERKFGKWGESFPDPPKLK